MSPQRPSVRYERSGPVAWVTIDRPEARNALNASVRQGLFDRVEQFNHDADALVMVLTGAGDLAFCAGGDLKEMAEVTLGVPPADFLPQFGRNIAIDKPTIAAVNGVAYAGGFLLAQNCDLCVAADTARFAISEVKVGRGAPWAVPLPWMIPSRMAMELLLTGDPIGSARAYELGLVNRVVPLADLAATTQQLAERIAANAPLSVRDAKRTVRLIADHPMREAFEEAERIWESVYLSRDAQEGPAAFRDRRPPRWEAR